ncbi:thioredoxin-disulfide reductase [Alkalitalea saponilacus]|uniref:Thioredoxin reductase n=1 Tax=Alkalitalea saponilacus TaxID=889453 RepID=A0A1T5HRZ1_9BACT|nr:thioredoxin-disulfide reductase [Alkalitalea saponilacus]ASB50029.1 thioredoxin-disulfide reductase [Alkalitalea saponilacus]SKC23456.1 thioredoxin reductase (NADPH) [Alkalitalea saponilacus]
MALFGKMDTSGEKAGGTNEITDVEKVKVLIIGSGPAGYTAAIYAARANLSPVMYEGLQPGGQLTTTTEVENFPGYPSGITGPEMMEDLKKQAERFGTSVRFGMATKADFSKRPFKVTIDDKKMIEAEAVIIATGATAKYLGLEDEKKYAGGGVSACATCDGFFYRGKDVAVVGGGDTAAEEALYLAGLCNKVYLIVRRDELRASKVMQERVFNAPNIEILWKHQTKGLFGDGVVEGATLVKEKGTPNEEEVKIKIDGFFLAIGHTPNSDIFKEYLETDETGYIKTISGSAKTNVPGIFACGDVQDHIYRQAVTAAGSGCMAAIDAERWLAENPLK